MATSTLVMIGIYAAMFAFLYLVMAPKIPFDDLPKDQKKAWMVKTTVVFFVLCVSGVVGVLVSFWLTIIIPFIATPIIMLTLFRKYEDVLYVAKLEQQIAEQIIRGR